MWSILVQNCLNRLTLQMIGEQERAEKLSGSNRTESVRLIRDFGVDAFCHGAIANFI